MRRTALLILLALATLGVTLSAEDSPLVQASKRSRRNAAKPKTIITNRDLKKSGGHITTTSKSAALPAKTRPAKQTPPVPAGPVTTPAPPLPPDPVDDAYGIGPEEREAATMASDGVIANIPATIAARPQLTKPKIAPPTSPSYTKPVIPPTTPSVTPQYTPSPAKP